MSGLAVVGLEFDGVNLQDWDNGIFLKIRSGLYEGVSVRGKDVTIPYSDGQEPRARRADLRKILVDGLVFAPLALGDEVARHAGYRTARRQLEDLFRPWRMPANLVATFDDGETATIAARPLNVSPDVALEEEIAKIVVELESVAPHWTWANNRVGSAAIAVLTSVTATGTNP